jgi:hypothetical protein
VLKKGSKDYESSAKQNWMKKISLAFVLLLVSLPLFSQVQINEICPANADIAYDTTFYEFTPWVELYNSSASDISVAGYYLTDDPSTPLKWPIPANTVIPAKGYLLIWCDENNKGFHTNFSLDADGEYLRLSKPNGAIVDEVTFPVQHTNISYGRNLNGATWGYFKSPSPNKINGVVSPATKLGNPAMSRPGGKYTSEITVTLEHSRSGVQIRYTLDGSEPTEAAMLYSFPIVLNSSKTIKAKAYHDSFLPSNTIVESFIITDREFSLPIVSLSLNPKYLTNDTIGIYVAGTNGIPGMGSDVPLNWNQNWFRHADFEYFKSDGEKLFDQSVDIRLYGNWSRRKPQKSFAVKARDKYGNNDVDHKLFPTKNVYEFGGFILRNAGTDWNVTHFRDALMQYMSVGQLGLDYLDYQPAVIFLNGEYWGIQNLRERIDADYFKSNFGLDNTQIDLLEGRSTVHEGTRDYYKQYRDSLEKINLTDVSAIKFVERYIDVQNFINYQVHNIYIANTDWPGNNIKYWRPRTAGGKFRWILWDCDFGFGLYSDKSYPTLPSLEWATDPDNEEGANRSWSTLHLRLLLANPVFKQRFISTLATAIQTTYQAERLIPIIDQFERRLRKEMPYHFERWGGKFSDWTTRVQGLRDFAEQRNPYMLQHMKEFFDLQHEAKLDIKVIPENGGTYRLNGVQSNKTVTDGVYFQGFPFQAEAIPQNGYRFKGWKVHNKSTVTTQPLTYESQWKYYDKGTLPASNWTAAEYADASWVSGSGKLGYGYGNEKTKISFGGNTNAKYVTTYFRKQVTIEDLSNATQIIATMLYDDGAAVYVNGVEVYRANLPTGDLTYSTFAVRNLSTEGSASFYIDKNLFVEGVNTLAVEIHQSSLTSSDLSFDLKLSMLKAGEYQETTSLTNTVTGIAMGDVTLEATFEQINGIVINEFSAENSILEDESGETEDWIEIFNGGTQTVDIGGYYITDDLHSKTKYQLPQGDPKTILPPGSYLILWADGETAEGATHVNFKLSGEGEGLGLYKQEGNSLLTLDEIIFSIQLENQSWARSPNGTGAFGLTNYTTPQQENPLVLDAAPENPTGHESTFEVYPNPVTGVLHFKSPKPLSSIYIFDSLGKLMIGYELTGDADDVDLSHLPSGIYFVRGQGNGQTFVQRVVKQ